MSLGADHPWTSGRGVRSPITDEIRALLGTMPDAALAQFAGVTVGTAYKWRTQAGIAAFTSAKSHPGSGGARKRTPAPARSIDEIMAANPPEFRTRRRDVESE